MSLAKYTMTAFVIFFHHFEFLSCFPIRLNDSFIALVLGGPLLPRFLFLSCCCCFLAFTAISYLAGCLVQRCLRCFHHRQQLFAYSVNVCFCLHQHKCSHTDDFDLSCLLSWLVISTAFFHYCCPRGLSHLHYNPFCACATFGIRCF